MSFDLMASPPTPSGAAPATVRTRLAYLLPICFIATLGGLLFGYDTGVISGAIEPLTARFHLGDFMKGWASGCVLIGCAAGVLLVGPVSDRFGRRLAMFLAAAMFLASAIGTALAAGIGVFILFRIMGGVGIGIASISTPMYIAEITPAAYSRTDGGGESNRHRGRHRPDFIRQLLHCPTRRSGLAHREAAGAGCSARASCRRFSLACC